MIEFPYGKILDEIPKEYVPAEMWPEYGNITDPPPICKREIVGSNPEGIRWSLGPFTLEKYWGDIAPDLIQSQNGLLARNRVIFWHRVHTNSKELGWYSAPRWSQRVDGFQRLDENFLSRWKKNARRDLHLWSNHTPNRYQIREITENEYVTAYKKSTVAKQLHILQPDYLTLKLANPLTFKNITLWGIENKKTKEIVAGTAVIFSPQHRSSTHYAPFILPEAREICGATALVHNWFIKSLERNYPIVTTRQFWHPGRPKDWKGFSEFKSHFGFEYVAYPMTLWRLKTGRIF